MKFGVHFQLNCASWQSPHERYRDTLDVIQLADEVGFDNAWLAEMHFDPRHCITPSPLMVAAAAAQRTNRIRLGVAVSLLPLHNPIRVAEDVATLDLLSDGRAEFGIGRGARTSDYGGYSVPLEESKERLMESLAFIIKGWTSDTFSFEGKYYSAKNLSLVPKPLQVPYPPVRVASNSSDTFELVGSLGHDLFVSTTVLDMDKLRDGLGRYREGLRAAEGTPNGDVNLQVPAYVGETMGAARQATEFSINHYVDVLREGYDNPATRLAAKTNPGIAQMRDRFGTMTYERWTEQIGVFGDPAHCVSRLRSLQEDLGLGGVSFMVNSGGLIERRAVMDTIRLFARDVMPHFK